MGVPKKNGGVKRYKVKKIELNFFFNFFNIIPQKPRPNFSNRPLKINPFQNLFYPGFKKILSGGAIWNSFRVKIIDNERPGASTHIILKINVMIFIN